MKKRTSRKLVAAGLVVAILGGGFVWFRLGTAPTTPGPSFVVRFNTERSLASVLQELQIRGVVRNPDAYRLYAFLRGRGDTVEAGSYRFHPGETAGAVLGMLRHSIRQMVRLPDTNWAKRNANLLERHDVITSADEYMALVHDPPQLAGTVSFPLPKHSLEGYLYPDTYNLPPLFGAKPVVEKQLREFESKAWPLLKDAKDPERVLKVASLVQLEAGTDADRPRIAGVIENRLKKHMFLQIDASILYGLQKWRRLYYKDYKEVHSPYNLYLHRELPPTPICSPNVKSIAAALHPEKHDYYYYIAMPNGKTVFSKTIAEHEHNIKLRQLMVKARGAKP